MARRKELKNIASGLYGSFISRNNDVGGYWGIGKLRLHAHQHGVDAVVLDLLSESIEPPNTEFSRLLAGYHSLLQTYLAAKKLPVTRVSCAKIELDFNPSNVVEKFIPMLSWGGPFKLTVQITDDLAKHYRILGFGRCRPHDPGKESKRREGYVRF